MKLQQEWQSLLYIPFQRPFTTIGPRTPDPMVITTTPTVEEPDSYSLISGIITGIIACLIIIILVILAFCIYCVKQNRSKKAQRGCNGEYTIEETFNIEERGARRCSNNSTYGQFSNFFRNIPIRMSSRLSRSELRSESRPDSLIDVNIRQTQSRQNEIVLLKVTLNYDSLVKHVQVGKLSTLFVSQRCYICRSKYSYKVNWFLKDRVTH